MLSIRGERVQNMCSTIWLYGTSQVGHIACRQSPRALQRIHLVVNALNCRRMSTKTAGSSESGGNRICKQCRSCWACDGTDQRNSSTCRFENRHDRIAVAICNIDGVGKQI